MSETRPAVSVSAMVAAGVVVLAGIATSVGAIVAIAPYALVLLVDTPFDASGETGRMLLASACAVIVPAPLTTIALLLTVARRPVPAIAFGLVAVVLAGGVGLWVTSYFHEEPVVAADAGAVGRACAQPSECPAGYQCVGTIGTGEHCEIPCGDPPTCPAGTTCTNVDVIGPHCR